MHGLSVFLEKWKREGKSFWLRFESFSFVALVLVVAVTLVPV